MLDVIEIRAGDRKINVEIEENRTGDAALGKQFGLLRIENIPYALVADYPDHDDFEKDNEGRIFLLRSRPREAREASAFRQQAFALALYPEVMEDILKKIKPRLSTKEYATVSCALGAIL